MKQFTKDIIEIALYIFLGYLIAVGANKGLAYALDTDYPVVAVVSTSMEHSDEATYKDWFLERNFSEAQMKNWSFEQQGIKMGDIVVVYGTDFQDLNVGDVLVYKFPNEEPIIHRIVEIKDNSLYTKGDNNFNTDQSSTMPPIREENYKGKAVLHIPLFGWVKIIFMRIVG